MGAYLAGALMIMISWSFLAFIFGFSTGMIYALCGSALFCAFILYDTSNVMRHCHYDDYMIAAVELYLDIINLFLYILELLARD